MNEINSALKAFEEGEGADNGGPNRPWSALLINAVTEYYEKHVTTALVLLVHLMLGQTIPAANNKARAKGALAQKLCDMKIPVITQDIVQAWATRALAMTDGSADPGFVEAPHEFLSAAPSAPPPSPNSVGGRLRERDGRGGDSDGDDEHKHDDGKDKESTGMVTVSLKDLMSWSEQAKRPPESTPPKAPEQFEPAQVKLLKRVKLLITQHVYFDVTVLCDKHQSKLKSNPFGSSTKSLSLVDGALSVSDDNFQHCSDEYSTWDFRNGCENFLLLIKEIRPDVFDDRHRFFTKLWGAHDENTPISALVAYCKAFMLEYAAEDNWCDLWTTDAHLRIKHLVLEPAAAKNKSMNSSSPPPPVYPSQSANGGGKGGKGDKGVKRKTADQSSTITVSYDSRYNRWCWSRVAQVGDCNKTNCDDDHSCASCGGKHSAKDCKSYNPAKAKNNNKIRNNAARRGR